MSVITTLEWLERLGYVMDGNSALHSARREFRPYLREDVVAEHGLAAAFRAAASVAKAHAFREEACRFLAATSGRDFTDVQRLVTRVGSHWIPGSREELEIVVGA